MGCGKRNKVQRLAAGMKIQNKVSQRNQLGENIIRNPNRNFFSRAIRLPTGGRNRINTAGIRRSTSTVAKSVMLMLRPDLFDSVGVLKSLWLHRMQIATDRTDRVLDELGAANIDNAETAAGIDETNDSYFERWYL